MENNLLIVLLATMPTLIYSLVIYFMLPKKMVNPKKMRKYFGIGLASPLIVILFHYSFPGLTFGNSMIVIIFCMAFFEELSKYLTYKWITISRDGSKYDLPVSTMMYSLSVAAGFAIVENIQYAMMLPEEAIKVTLIRGLSANILHLICGLMIGFFIAKSRMVKSLKFKPSKFKKIRLTAIKIMFVSLGIILSSLYHAFYNSNALINISYKNFTFTTFVLFVFGIFITYWMFKELIADSKKIDKEIKK